MNNSSKRTIAIVSVLVLLLILGFVFKNKMKPNASSSNSSEIAMTDDGTTMSGSMWDLLKLGSTTTCTYSTDQDGTKMTGTTYVSGKKMRSDTNVTMKDGKTMETHMISDGTWVYTWSSMLPQGMKMKIEEFTAPEDSSEPTKVDNEAVKEFQKDFDFKCSKWGGDNSKFEVPSNVTFTDFSETMRQMNSGGSMCAACDYAPDADSKAKCKAQMGCN